MTEKRLSKEWEVSAFDRVNNEWSTTMNHAYEVTPELADDLFVSQAPPIRVTPSKRKRTETDWLDTVACIGDIHFPFQNDTRLSLAQVAMKETQPTIISLMGDNLDNTNYSRFGTRKEWADSTQEGIDQYAKFLGQLRSDHPDARILWHEGNHDVRTEKRVREYNEDLLGIKRAGETHAALSLEFLLRVDELGVELVKGYPSARTVVRNNLELYHGHVTASRGLAASKVISEAFMSFATGHTHQLGIVSKTYHIGNEEKTIYGAEAGTFADPSLTPSGKYAPNTNVRMNWQSGVINWLINEEEAIPSIAPITDDGVMVNGKYYKS